MKRLTTILTMLLLALTVPAAASAMGARITFHRPTSPIIMTADNQDICVNQNRAPLAYLSQQHATVMRVVLAYGRPVNQALPCVRQARRAGYRVYLSVNYNDALSVPALARWYLAEVKPYLPYLWAVSLGNEQEGPPGQAPYVYRWIWNRVEPTLAREAPHVIRVFGEVTPWGENWLQMAWQTGGKPPKGVGAISGHAYLTKTLGLRNIPAFARWAAKQHKPFWASEMGPDPYWSSEWINAKPISVYNATLRRVERQSPNLKMVSVYYWPIMTVFGWQAPVQNPYPAPGPTPIHPPVIAAGQLIPGTFGP
jgi:hypothetical protein